MEEDEEARKARLFQELESQYVGDAVAETSEAKEVLPVESS